MSKSELFAKSNYKNRNRVIYSKVLNYENNEARNKDLSIKYVIEGNEQYQLNNGTYNIKSGQFLLVNPNNKHKEYVRSETQVAGICMSLSTDLITDVYATSIASSNYLLDNPVSILKAPVDVYEAVYNSDRCALGEAFRHLALLISDTSFEISDPFNFYCSVAEKLLHGQGIIHQKIYQVNAKRSTTQKELYRRIEIGRSIIEQNYFKPLEIESIAAASAMSSFHFSRTFKQVFNMSPYQYIIHIRLERSKRHIKDKRYSISEIATLVGFSDITAFSKSFKNAFKVSPSKYSLHC